MCSFSDSSHVSGGVGEPDKVVFVDEYALPKSPVLNLSVLNQMVDAADAERQRGCGLLAGIQNLFGVAW
jgi:hypothetical protein